MKNSIKSLAFLVASVAFTACTNQSIEPMRPTTSLQSSAIWPDTTSQITTEDYQQSRKSLHGKMMISDEINQDISQPEVIVEPTPHTAPIATPYPKPHLDVMPIEQLESGIN